MTPSVRRGGPYPLSLVEARRIWLRAQRLDVRDPFGGGPEATTQAIEHLGYVQIDTINVIERSHHHILYSRIPAYRRADLARAQSLDKTVFEYWTHALAYLPMRDFRHYVGPMRGFRDGERHGWGGDVPDAELKRIMRLVRDGGAISIRDIDEEPVEKLHLWASRKPSKPALQRGFFEGRLAISARTGMLKTYELMERHFGWERLPAPASERQTLDYLLDRGLRTQGFFSLDSIRHTRAGFRPGLMERIETRLRRRRLVPATLAGDERVTYWVEPEALEAPAAEPTLTHILSPFDPLVIQRKRLAAVFGYAHVFEAYVPKAKRRFGYFSLPVLVGDAIVAVLDLKAERATKTLLIQAWHWVGPGTPAAHKRLIEEELERFAAFQFGD